MLDREARAIERHRRTSRARAREAPCSEVATCGKQSEDDARRQARTGSGVGEALGTSCSTRDLRTEWRYPRALGAILDNLTATCSASSFATLTEAQHSTCLPTLGPPATTRMPIEWRDRGPTRAEVCGLNGGLR